MRTIEKGSIAELEVQLALVKAGFTVFTPVNEGCKIDLVFVDASNVANKVQVKKALATTCGFALDFRYNIGRYRNKTGKYTKEDIDYFATVFNGLCYLIPIEHVLGRTRVVLRLNNAYINQEEILRAKNYVLKEKQFNSDPIPILRYKQQQLMEF